MEKSIDAILDKCWNYYSHEGSFELFGHTVNVFRKCGYTADNGEYIETSGDVCAFIDSEYFTGWYEENIGSDLREVMQDVSKQLFKDKLITFKFTGALNYDVEENQIPASTVLKSLKENILAEYMNLFDIQENSLKIKCNKTDLTFSGSFTGTWSTLCELYFDQNTSMYLKYGDVESIECNDEAVKTYMNDAFNYSLSF